MTLPHVLQLNSVSLPWHTGFSSTCRPLLPCSWVLFNWEPCCFQKDHAHVVSSAHRPSPYHPVVTLDQILVQTSSQEAFFDPVLSQTHYTTLAHVYDVIAISWVLFKVFNKYLTLPYLADSPPLWCYLALNVSLSVSKCACTWACAGLGDLDLCKPGEFWRQALLATSGK